MNSSPVAVPIIVNVGIISGNSGVYISEQNVFLGVSSHSKSNSGLGSIGSKNIVSGNTNVVDDRDLIDTPIDDRDVKIYQQAQEDPASKITQVGFDTIKVATITQNSGIFVGDVKITGLDSHSKQNSAQGTTYGNENVEMQNFNYVYDSDTVDTSIQDQDVKILAGRMEGG